MLIVDLGGQYTTLIGRVLRELGVRSVILPPRAAEQWIDEHRDQLKGIIISGGGASINELAPADLAPSILATSRPTLGICLGMHWMARDLGGEVASPQEQRGYGAEEIEILVPDDPLLRHVAHQRNTVWMSHGDSVTKLPPGFRRTARGKYGQVAAMSSDDGTLFAVQFHPEVPETECGREILAGFLTVCGTERDWQPLDVVRKIQEDVATAIGLKEQAILAFSGGRDSTILAAIIIPILGDRLTCVTIDTGALPEGEDSRIRWKARTIGCRLAELSRRRQFITAVASAGQDGDAKRIAFRQQYIAALEEVAAVRHEPWLIQGTVYSDMIESGMVGEAEKIVLHHNPGLETPLSQLHPFKELFKDEVQELGRALGLPPEITEAEPFPGPGYFIRIVGAPVSLKLLSIVRWADAKVRQVIAEFKLTEPPSQLVVALNAVELGNVRGDRRYKDTYAVVVRAVKTATFMTACGYTFPDELRKRIRQAVIKHGNIADVWFSEGDKPPMRIELQ